MSSPVKYETWPNKARGFYDVCEVYNCVKELFPQNLSLYKGKTVAVVPDFNMACILARELTRLLGWPKP